MNDLAKKLDAMGFREIVDGTAMLRTGIALYERNMALTKDLYPAIARAHGTTASRVERNMRYAIDNAWQDPHGLDVRRSYFGSGYGQCAPTVGEFIAHMAREERWSEV